MLELSKNDSKTGVFLCFNGYPAVEFDLVNLIDKVKMRTKPKKSKKVYKKLSDMVIKFIDQESSDFVIKDDALIVRQNDLKVADFIIYHFASLKDKRKRRNVKYRIYLIYFFKDNKISFLAVSDETKIELKTINDFLEKYGLTSVTGKNFKYLIKLSDSIKKNFGIVSFVIENEGNKMPDEQKIFYAIHTPLSVINEATGDENCSSNDCQVNALKIKENIYNELHALLNISSPLNGLHIFGYYLYSGVFEYINKNNRYALNISAEKQFQKLLTATISLYQEIFFGNLKKLCYVSNISDKKILDKIYKNKNCAYIIDWVLICPKKTKRYF